MADRYSAIDARLWPGSRIAPAARTVVVTCGHCDETHYPSSFHAKGKAVGDSIDEVRLHVRGQRKYGAVCAAGGAGFSGPR